MFIIDEGRAADYAARAVCRRRLPHLDFATHFLKPSKRQAMRAFAAFIAISCDAVTPAGTTTAGCCSDSGLVPLLRDQIDRIYNGSLELPNPALRDEPQQVLHAFWRATQRFEIPRNHLIAWLDATVASQSVLRYPTWSALERHIHQTTGSLALLAASILGVTRSDATPLIMNCASGIRLTEILGRISTDRAAGRIFIPLADLAQHRYSERQMLAGETHENFSKLMRCLSARARGLLEDGHALIPWLAGDGSRAAAAALLVQYSRLLARIDARPEYVLNQPLAPRGYLRHLPSIYRLAWRAPAAITPSSSPSSA